MSLTKKEFGATKNGETVWEYTLRNEAGCGFSVISYGAYLKNLWVPDKDGKLRDVCLGFDTMERYESDNNGSAGAVVGRYANRIGNACFTLEGQSYALAHSKDAHTLHSDIAGMHHKVWSIQEVKENEVILKCTSPDGEGGFPGEFTAEVSYLFENNTLRIHYRATTTKNTVCSMTNHAYFNLNGHACGDMLNHELQINADLVTETDMDLIPTGRFLSADQVAYSFLKPRTIRDALAHMSEDAIFEAKGGVDFNYCAGRDKESKIIASLYSPESGIRMNVITDQPGIQVYTGMSLDFPGKDGAMYVPYAGIALETQHYPDSPNKPHFPSTLLRPQDVYDTETDYAFTIE